MHLQGLSIIHCIACKCERSHLKTETVDVEHSKVETGHYSSKYDHECNAGAEKGPVRVRVVATNGLDQHSDISLEEDANVHSDEGEQLKGCLAASWIQQGCEPEAILPAPVSQTACSFLHPKRY